MNNKSINTVIASQLEIISQGQNYLELISDEEYNYIPSPNFVSSCGSHIRHIIDHYLAIKVGASTGLIDYDVRSRGEEVESNRLIAIEMLSEIANWINSLSVEDLNNQISISTEVSISKKETHSFSSSLGRELIFAASHAIHHYAIITQISTQLKTKTPEGFGIAPATSSFLREQKLSGVKKQNILNR